jgi:hypothetical protein
MTGRPALPGTVKKHNQCGAIMKHSTLPFRYVFRRNLFLGFLAGFLGLGSGPALADLIPYDAGPLVFDTSGQSIWSGGPSTVVDTGFFAGTEWGPVSDSLDLTVLGTGPKVSASTEGKLGLQFGAKVDSGTVAATVAYGATALLPDTTTGTGTFFNLNPDSTLAGSSAFSTTSPSVEATMDLVFGLKASVGAEVCATFVGCTGGTVPIISIGSKASPEIVDLVAFNEGKDGKLKILGFDTGIIGSPAPINVAGTNVGNVTVDIPNIETTGSVVPGDKLTSGGEDNFLTATVDIDGLATLALALPPLEGSVDIAGIASASYNVLDLELGPVLTVFQDFELEPTLWVELEFDNPVLVAGMADPVTTFKSAWDMLPDIAMLTAETEVWPTFFLDVDFTNMTGLGLDMLFLLDILSVGFDVFGFDLLSLGPLFSFSKTFDVVDFPPIFNETFALAGFGEVEGAHFTIKVPEPSSLAILALGLIALGVFGSGRRRA